MEKVDLHPTFDISTYIGDVAVVTLTANIDPRDAARRGVYPAQLGTPSQIRYGSYIRLSGWGVSNKAGRGGGGVARAPPVHAQGAGWPQPGHHARRKKEGRAAKAAKDDDTDDADDADGADDATAWQAAAATRRTVRGRSGGGNRTGVSPRATAAQRAAAGTRRSSPGPMPVIRSNCGASRAPVTPGRAAIPRAAIRMRPARMPRPRWSGSFCRSTDGAARLLRFTKCSRPRQCDGTAGALPWGGRPAPCRISSR